MQRAPHDVPAVSLRPPVPGARLGASPDVVAAYVRGGDVTGEAGELANHELLTGLTVVVCTYRRAPSVRRFLDSLAGQERQPERLVIVDASPDDATEREVRAWDVAAATGPAEVRYLRVTGALRGLTRQRNTALHLVDTDLVAFFDDDVVLLPHCLARMEAVHREAPLRVAGVGAFAHEEAVRPWALWRVRRALRVVPDLEPGRYHGAGISIPWEFHHPTRAPVAGDWLPGYAMMWRTAVVRAVGFNAAFAGYAQGEDLDLSVRARRHGALIMAGDARVRHLHEAAGRPDAFRIGYMAIANRYQIHRRAQDVVRRRDTVRFAYVWTVDTVLLARYLVVPGRIRRGLLEIAGRVRAAVDIARGAIR
ncbi:MAG: glycosyltransferase family 2 protein [Gemmatimonadaceae bacterium]|nr:glycosyltransferase family 2 protein [Gemmatimonadaceae bacterium]